MSCKRTTQSHAMPTSFCCPPPQTTPTYLVSVSRVSVAPAVTASKHLPHHQHYTSQRVTGRRTALRREATQQQIQHRHGYGIDAPRAFPRVHQLSIMTRGNRYPMGGNHGTDFATSFGTCLHINARGSEVYAREESSTT